MGSRYKGQDIDLNKAWEKKALETTRNGKTANHEYVFAEERGGKGTESRGVCLNGRCEFVLSCWMSSGLIDGSCGGFLYACCQRLDRKAPKTNEHHVNDIVTLPTNFGPVVNDFSKFSNSFGL